MFDFKTVMEKVVYVSSGHVGHEGGYMLVETTLRDIDSMFSE